MLPITHITLPLLAARAVPLHRGWLTALALCCVAPDLLHIHIGLYERQHSWTHTVWPALVFAALAAPVAWRWRTRRLPVLLLPAGYAAHLALDAISGGIMPVYPVSEAVLGSYLVPPAWWIVTDAGLLPILGLLFLRPRTMPESPAVPR